MLDSSWKLTARTIILALLIGAGAGVLASAITTNYLSSYAVQLGELTAPLRLSEERPRAFPQSYALSIEAVKDKALPGVAQFYAATSPVILGVRTLHPDEAAMSGAVLTSDGWILTMPLQGAQVVSMTVVVGDRAYSVKQVVEDSQTGLSFVKIDAANLPVLAFGSGWNVGAGEQLFLLPEREAIVATSVLRVDRGEGYAHASDQPSRRLVLNEQTRGELYRGAPIVDLDGELVGLADPTDTLGGFHAFTYVVPIDGMLPALASLLKEGKISRPKFGADTIDLAHAPGVTETMSRGRTVGAYVPRGSITPAGPAAKAGLKEEDIILSVDGEFLTGDKSLDEFIVPHAIGDMITLMVDRAGKELSIELVLGKMD